MLWFHWNHECGKISFLSSEVVTKRAIVISCLSRLSWNKQTHIHHFVHLLTISVTLEFLVDEWERSKSHHQGSGDVIALITDWSTPKFKHTYDYQATCKLKQHTLPPNTYMSSCHTNQIITSSPHTLAVALTVTVCGLTVKLAHTDTHR